MSWPQDERRVLRNLADQFWSGLVGISNQLPAQVRSEAAAVGVDWLYVFYLLNEQGRAVSRLLSDTEYKALNVLLDVFRRSGATDVEYERARMPATTSEASVDDAIKKIGRWALRSLKQDGTRALSSALRGQARPMLDAMRAAHGDDFRVEDAIRYMMARLPEVAASPGILESGKRLVILRVTQVL